MPVHICLCDCGSFQIGVSQRKKPSLSPWYPPPLKAYRQPHCPAPIHTNTHIAFAHNSIGELELWKIGKKTISGFWNWGCLPLLDVIIIFMLNRHDGANHHHHCIIIMRMHTERKGWFRVVWSVRGRGVAAVKISSLHSTALLDTLN